MQTTPPARKSTPVSVRLQPALNDQLAAVAAALDRPKSWVIEQAIKEFVALEEWRLTAIDEGIKAADEGRVVSHEEVRAWVGSWGHPDERPAPECE